jgi:hypothetical protein
MGLGAGAGSERIAHPGPPDLLLCARADLCRSSPVCGTVPDVGRRTGQVHRAEDEGLRKKGAGDVQDAASSEFSSLAIPAAGFDATHSSGGI